jgi:ABC-type multidrug transport system fused ATPase/permease subunit
VTAHRFLFKDLVTRLGWRFPLLVVWTALVGLSEGTSIVLLLPLLDRAGIVTTSSQGLANTIINNALALVGARSMVEILILVSAVATVQMILSVGLNWWSIRLARSYQAQRQLQLFSVFMRAKWKFMVDRKAGEMTNATTTECERLVRAFTLAMALFGGAIVALIYVALSAFIAWQATLILIAFAIAVALAMTGFYRKSYAVGQSIAPLNAELQTMLEEQFAGAKFVKASVGVDRAAIQVERLVRRLSELNAAAAAMPGTVRALLEYAALIGVATILVLSSAGFGIAPGNVIIVLALFGRLFPRFTTVQAQLYGLNANVHAVEALNKMQTAAESEAERTNGSSYARLEIQQPTVLSVRDLQVKFGERIMLDGINLAIPIPGLFAIVGKSGAGKSTLVHTLLGLVEPSAGLIQLGHYQFASAPLAAWRRSIGYVPQETILFHASIKDNLKLVNPAASEDEIKTASRRAHALEFIVSLSDGFDTIIGDQGVKLSGGQRQRLGIARALLMNPSLLVMDEGMSALDAESEVDLLETLEELRGQIGILLVAHRLAAARTADVVCVLEAGRVVEAGSWNELMTRKKRLYALSEAQSLGENQPVPAL